jgi:hypothetical protein
MNGKLLKGVGLALIALPEPFTTPIGAGLIAASFVISKTEENKKRKYLRHILGEYLNTYRPFGFGMDYTPHTSANLPYREKRPLYDRNITPNTTPVYSPHPSPSVAAAKTAYRPVQFAPRDFSEEPKRNSFVHTLDPRVVAKRFVETGGTRAGFVGYWGRQTKLDLSSPVQHHLRLTPAALS